MIVIKIMNIKKVLLNLHYQYFFTIFFNKIICNVLFYIYLFNRFILMATDETHERQVVLFTFDFEVSRNI